MHVARTVSEPQVAITWDLVDQAGADVLLVPEAVRLYLCAVDTDELQSSSQPEMRRLADDPVFVLSADAVRSWGTMSAASDVLPARTVRLCSPVSEADRIMLETEITVRVDIRLTAYESGLTRPCFIGGAVPSGVGDEVALRYRLSPPGNRAGVERLTDHLFAALDGPTGVAMRRCGHDPPRSA